MCRRGAIWHQDLRWRKKGGEMSGPGVELRIEKTYVFSRPEIRGGSKSQSTDVTGKGRRGINEYDEEKEKEVGESKAERREIKMTTGKQKKLDQRKHKSDPKSTKHEEIRLSWYRGRYHLFSDSYSYGPSFRHNDATPEIHLEMS
ncbi:hypothetical protein SCHPADRAFT_894988 [Schizopora paradoxa]|uniref:Uncharacterized protein n=1 Tax=Schizopora paradoxa TaxID=27342 RepID=A0A0H2R6N4_9AGAM|nr:hypothetical protein SCHPADRAFT_894988 [Schizopora paradoxa]